jgi:hypothetical protein
MAYDERGRWIPSEDIDWSLTEPDDLANLRTELTKSGLDWRHEGKYAFRTNDWGELSESQRLGVLQAYDHWYDTDVDRNINLADEDWGLDIERNVSYNMDEAWSAQNFFHQMTGGNFQEITIGKDIRKTIVTKDRHGNVIDIQYGDKGEGRVGIAGDKHSYEWGHLTNPYKYSEKVRGTFLGEVRTADGEHISTTYQVRENPMDWKAYTNDELYRATMDELLEKDYMMFMGPGSDFDNARQVRAASKEIQSWVDKHYKKAHEEGRDGASAEAEWEKDRALQIARAKVHNVRYPEGKNTRGYQHNQQVQIRKYQPWNKFDPETGTRTKINPVTGEIRDTFKHKLVPQPTRMTIVGDKLEQNLDEGIFYSPTFGSEQEITDSMLREPSDIPKPNLSIRKVTPERPANVDAGWKLKGDVK